MLDGTGIAPNRQFYLAGTAYAAAHGDILARVLDAITAADGWISHHEDEAAATLAPATGIPAQFLAPALARPGYGAAALTPAVVADQQRIADAFLSLQLIRQPINVASAVRKLPA